MFPKISDCVIRETPFLVHHVQCVVLQKGQGQYHAPSVSHYITLCQKILQLCVYCLENKANIPRIQGHSLMATGLQMAYFCVCMSIAVDTHVLCCDIVAYTSFLVFWLLGLPSSFPFFLSIFVPSLLSFSVCVCMCVGTCVCVGVCVHAYTCM